MSSTGPGQRERVYRLVYVISQFETMRRRITNSDDDGLLDMLWGPGSSVRPNQLFSRLMQSNADAFVRSLLAHAEMRRVLEDGTMNGFFLPDSPPGLHGVSMGAVRREASRNPVPTHQKNLVDRLGSENDPLWFVTRSRNLAQSIEHFLQTLVTNVITPKLSELVKDTSLTDNERQKEARRFFRYDVLPNQVSGRAAEQFVCADIALAIGLLQVVVIDDEVSVLQQSPSPNASLLLRAYPEAMENGVFNVDRLYHEWMMVMQKHDRALRILRKLVHVSNIVEPTYQSLLRSVQKLDSITIQIKGVDEKVEATKSLTSVASRSSFREIGKTMQQMGQMGRKMIDKFSDGLSKPLKKKTAPARYARWLNEYVQAMRETAGKVFVFCLSDDDNGKCMRPGWHMYAERDWRSKESDEGLIKEWMRVLIDSNVHNKPYAPADEARVSTCKSVFDRTAMLLGMVETDKYGTQKLTPEAEKLRTLTCNTPESCLDNQYVQVRNDTTLGDNEDRSNALAKRLLEYKAIGCGDEKVATAADGSDRRHITQILCERRIRQACDKTSEAECGASVVGGVNNLVTKMCDPTAQLRNRISKECAIVHPITSAKRYNDDARCIKAIATQDDNSEATCYTELLRKCDEGREGWGLIQALQQRKDIPASPVTKICAQTFGNLQEIKDMLDEFDRTSTPTVCGKLKRLESSTIDDVLNELVIKVRNLDNMQCGSVITTPQLDRYNIGAFELSVEQTINSVRVGRDGRNYLPGGVVISPEQYKHMKSFKRIANLSTDVLQQLLNTVFRFIEVQCVGMGGVTSDDIMYGHYGVSKYVHYMLYPQFAFIVNKKDIDSTLYSKVVGCEYVDWWLIVLDNFTKEATSREVSIEDALKNSTSALRAKNTFIVNHASRANEYAAVSKDAMRGNVGVERVELLKDPYVFEHLYQSLSGFASSSDRRRGVQSIFENDIDLIIHMNDVDVIAKMTKRNAGQSEMRRLAGTYEPFEWILTDETLEKTTRRFNSQRLRSLTTSNVTWWRRLLTMSVFAPRSSIAFTELQAMVEEAYTTKDYLSDLSFEQLYAALLCIESSAPDIQFASTFIVKAMGNMVMKKMDRANYKQVTTVNNVNEKFAPLITEVMRAFVAQYMYNGEPTKKKRDKNERSYKNDKAESKEIYNKIIVQDRFNDQEKAFKTFVQDIVNSYTDNMERSLSELITDARVNLQNKDTARLGIQHPKPQGESWGSRILKMQMFKQLLYYDDDSPPTDEPRQFQITRDQFKLFTAMRNKGESRAKEVLAMDITLQCLLHRYPYMMDDKVIEHVDEVSELLHAARFGYDDVPNWEKADDLPFTLRPSTTYYGLLTSRRFVWKNDDDDLECSENVCKMLANYTRALYAVLPAIIAVGVDRLSHDSGFAEALFRVCCPDPRSQGHIGALANRMADFRHNKLFKDTDDTLRKLHVYTIITECYHKDKKQDRKLPVYYFPINSKDEKRIDALVKDKNLNALVKDKNLNNIIQVMSLSNTDHPNQ